MATRECYGIFPARSLVTWLPCPFVSLVGSTGRNGVVPPPACHAAGRNPPAALAQRASPAACHAFCHTRAVACGCCGRSPKPRRLLAVSYTHLRAHETRHDLVCRLLLEKKKK